MRRTLTLEVVFGALWILMGSEFFLARFLAEGVAMPTPPGSFWVFLSLLEIAGGACLVTGLATRWGQALLLPGLAMLAAHLPSFSLAGIFTFYALVTVEVTLLMASRPAARLWRTHPRS